VDAVEAAGGQCLKWTSPGTTGLPDRIALLPGARIAFIEMKRPKGSKVGPLQRYWRRVLTGLGFVHWWTYTEADIEALLLHLEVRQ
jgi:hypothetical protein